MPKEDVVQLNANIKKAIHIDLKMQAVREGRTMSAILEDALTAYLANPSGAKIKKKG